MTWIILDSIVAVIFLLFLLKGARDGFAATVVKFFSVAIAFAVALVACKWISEFVYDSFVHQNIVSSLQSMDLLTDSAGAVQLQESLKNAGGFVGLIASNAGGSITAGLEGLPKSQVSVALSSMAQGISNNFIRPMFVNVLSIVFFLVLFSLLGIVLTLLVRGLKGVNKVPVLGTVNRVLGLVTGGGIGILLCFALVQVFKLWLMVSGNGEIQRAIDQTYIFQFFYNFKLF